VLDVKGLLQNYGVKNITFNGKDALFCCVFHDDHTPSCSMNLKTGVFHCFSCHAKGTVIDFVAKMENIDYEEAKTKIISKGITKIEIDLMELVRRKLFPEEKKVSEFLDESVLNKYKGFMHKSILERIPNKEVLKQFEISYSKEQNRTILPVRNHQGKLVGITAQSINKEIPRFKTLEPIKGFKKSNYLYGLNLCKGKLLIAICEGHFDVINFYNHGFPFAVGIMGSFMSEIQKNLLTRYTNHVVLALDNDEAGKNATKKIAEQLKGIVKINVITYPEGRKDPGEMNQVELYEALGGSKEYNA